MIALIVSVIILILFLVTLRSVFSKLRKRRRVKEDPECPPTPLIPPRHRLLDVKVQESNCVYWNPVPLSQSFKPMFVPLGPTRN